MTDLEDEKDLSRWFCLHVLQLNQGSSLRLMSSSTLESIWLFFALSVQWLWSLLSGSETVLLMVTLTCLATSHTYPFHFAHNNLFICWWLAHEHARPELNDHVRDKQSNVQIMRKSKVCCMLESVSCHIFTQGQRPVRLGLLRKKSQSLLLQMNRLHSTKDIIDISGKITGCNQMHTSRSASVA